MTSDPTDRPPALILGLSETGLGALRLLSRAGVQCWGADADPGAPGFRSRHCRRSSLLPDDGGEQRWLTELERLAGQAPKAPVLVPTGDSYVRLVSEHRERLARTCRLLVPDRDLVSALLDKEGLARVAAAHGWPVPPGLEVAGRDLARAADGLGGIPLILKPSRQGEELPAIGKARVLATPDELDAAVRDLADASERLLVQRHVAGPDEAERSVAVCLDQEGRLVAAFTARKRRQSNGGAGVGSYVEAHPDPEAEHLAVGLLRAVGYVGVAEVELKRDPASRVLQLIEINPRLWTQVTLPALHDLNFPLMAYELTTGSLLAPARPRPRKRPARWQDVRADCYWTFRAQGYRRRGAVSVPGWLWQTVRADARARGSLRDPRPALPRI